MKKKKFFGINFYLPCISARLFSLNWVNLWRNQKKQKCFLQWWYQTDWKQSSLLCSRFVCFSTGKWLCTSSFCCIVYPNWLAFLFWFFLFLSLLPLLCLDPSRLEGWSFVSLDLCFYLILLNSVMTIFFLYRDPQLLLLLFLHHWNCRISYTSGFCIYWFLDFWEEKSTCWVWGFLAFSSKSNFNFFI